MLPFALGSGLVAQKNRAFAIFLNVRSVSPCPAIRDGSSARASLHSVANKKDMGVLFTWGGRGLHRRDADPVEGENRLRRSCKTE